MGFLTPLNVIPLPDSKFLILNGEQRWKAALEAGLSYVTCCVHSDERWRDINEVDLQSFKLNALHGKTKIDSFQKLYKSLCERVGPDRVQDILAVTDTVEWKKLTRGIEQTLKERGATQNVLDEVKDAEKKAKDPADLSRRLGRILRDHATSSAASNAVVFQFGVAENIVIRSTAETFAAIKRLVSYANEAGKDINDLLGPALAIAINDLGGS